MSVVTELAPIEAASANKEDAFDLFDLDIQVTVEGPFYEAEGPISATCTCTQTKVISQCVSCMSQCLCSGVTSCETTNRC